MLLLVGLLVGQGVKDTGTDGMGTHSTGTIALALPNH